MNNTNPIISVRGLVTQFGNQQIIHDHLDLDIYKGEIFGRKDKFNEEEPAQAAPKTKRG